MWHGPLQVFAIEFVTFAINAIPFAVEFIIFAVEMSLYVIEFFCNWICHQFCMSLLHQIYFVAQELIIRNKVGSYSKHENKTKQVLRYLIEAQLL